MMDEASTIHPLNTDLSPLDEFWSSSGRKEKKKSD